MNPWLAAGLAAAALWFLRMNSNAQQQAQNAQAGTQAGAGQTSDQGGGSSFTPDSMIIPYQGGVTQPVSTMSYSPPGDNGSSGSSSGSGSGPIPSWPQYTGPTTINPTLPSYTGPTTLSRSFGGSDISSSAPQPSRPGAQL